MKQPRNIMKKRLSEEECDHGLTAIYEMHDGAIVNKCASCPFSYVLTDEEAVEHRRLMGEDDDKN